MINTRLVDVVHAAVSDSMDTPSCTPALQTGCPASEKRLRNACMAFEEWVSSEWEAFEEWLYAGGKRLRNGCKLDVQQVGSV